MANLKEIVEYLDSELRVSEVKDYPGAMNGLQMENDGNISRVISAVDASLAVIKEAAQTRNSLLLVHHGMFWQGAQPLTGAFFRKIKAAMEGNLAIYSSHLPLDMHPVVGNNVLLAEAIGLESVRPILVKDGWATGIAGEWAGSRDELAEAVKRAVGRDVQVCPGGDDRVSSVAVITGGAGSEVAKIAGLGFDAFVTGEGAHWSFIESEERGLNTFYAGHYATETFGVRRLGRDLAGEFELQSVFLDREGGL
jgi:dinuclear metal center YbgI/SA1388 family protein